MSYLLQKPRLGRGRKKGNNNKSSFSIKPNLSESRHTSPISDSIGKSKVKNAYDFSLTPSNTARSTTTPSCTKLVQRSNVVTPHQKANQQQDQLNVSSGTQNSLKPPEIEIKPVEQQQHETTTMITMDDGTYEVDYTNLSYIHRAYCVFST